MLVLLSFGLVLLATILLVVGLLNDDGIELIYFSISASATAAVVLYLAFRRARPQDDVRTDAPEPLPDDLEPRRDDSTVVLPAATAEAPAPAPAVPPVAAVSEPDPEPAMASTADSADDAWADDTDWEVDDLQFPIADYDELSVAEIMPLLPQLYSDELDVVYEREQTGKNRATILARLEKLKETGTEADAEEAQAVGDDAAETVEAPEPPPVPAPMPVPPTVSLLDDEDDDAGAFFPIADYDDLSVSQIVPLLPQLELDELEDVKAREQAGANRSTLIAEIDRYLSGELEAFSWSDADEEPADEAPTPAPASAPAAAPAAAPAGVDAAPIAGYDSMTVADIRPRLSDLSDAELERLLDYETARDNRKTIVADINRRLESGDDEPPAAPAAKATKRAAKASKRATKATKATKSTKKASKKAAKATKKQAAARFPIANYDELTVADIRPRLTKLSDAQLELVRERELTGAGRKTILNDIDSRLS